MNNKWPGTPGPVWPGTPDVPAFDPSKPFETVAPPFDPPKPYKVVGKRSPRGGPPPGFVIDKQHRTGWLLDKRS
jgi:hypothetical protein